MNGVLRAVLARCGRVGIKLTRRAFPPAKIVAVHGFPDDEENSLRLAGAAASRVLPGWRVVLLCEDPVVAQTAFKIAHENADYSFGEPEYVLKDSAAGIANFLRASYLFYTHTVFMSPDPGSRRFDVNVGHGHGPKRAENVTHHVAHRADMAVVNNRRWGGDVVDVQGLRRHGQLVVLHNPREDAFREKADKSKLAQLGIASDKPFVVWLPTYRRTISMSTAQWQDGTPISETPGTAEDLSRMADLARDAGVQLVTKFHPLDAEATTTVPGMITVTAEALQKVGLSFYQFIGLTDGLISDYSSIYVDYMVTGKPWALYFRDFESFTKARGFNEPDFRECAAELILSGDDDVVDFLHSVKTRSAWKQDSVTAFAEAIEFATDEYSSTLNLLRAAQDRATRKGVRCAFDRAALTTGGDAAAHTNGQMAGS